MSQHEKIKAYPLVSIYECLKISGVLEGGSISRLLAGEGAVGRYEELLKLGRRGDNLTPHHVPSNAYMTARVSGYARNVGIAIMMEHPIPGAGGRHRQTLSYGQSPDLSLLPRQVLAIEIQDLRSLYQREGVYTETIRRGLRAIIQLNQSAWTGVFEKRIILYESKSTD